MSRRTWPGTHPTIGAFLGFILLIVLVPYSLDYGMLGLAISLVLAGVVAGALARGGTGMGFGAGARAAAYFVLLLLSSLALILLEDSGMIDLSSSPEVGEFMPYIVLMESLWGRISATLSPVLQGVVPMFGGDRLVEIIVRVVAVVLPAGVGGALSGAVVGRPQPRPLPMDMSPYYPEGPYAPYQYDSPEPEPPGMAYNCPWCGYRILPHMVECWNCGGPLQMPPPPQY